MTPVDLATHVFFQMWRTRAFPYNRIAERDVVYIGDTTTRRVSWEVRVTDLLADFNYTSTRHCLSALRAAYGLYAQDLNGYHQDKAGRGWLLAWSPTVMRQLDVRLPDGIHFGQNGYRLLSDDDCTSIGLPRPKARSPLASPPNWYDPGAARTGVPRAPARYIPQHVKDAVIERDGNRCAVCGATSNLHFDHKIPFSHGGLSTVDNLRLLCGRSNLARGAGEPQGRVACG